MEIISTTRATINSLRFRSTDCVDQSIKLFSNFGASVKLPRNDSDDFSFDSNGLFVAKNLSGQQCTLDIEIINCTGDYIVVRSSRVGACTLKKGDKISVRFKGGESLTFRSNDARGKGAANL